MCSGVDGLVFYSSAAVGDQTNAPDRLIALDRHLLCTGLRWLSRRSSNTGHLEIEDRTANLKYKPMPRLEKYEWERLDVVTSQLKYRS